ncbi:hypothetical protein [Legionella cardiaca]|uniref:Substrate of the Dot/Icm secretion system n=1 Tax=Legionella cardiaca TaxID=1071983 RepID=A0ABY8AS13_9GAMM|nr:hypothetical protein [Legionella cardiaca]WED43458.1 hypothetical protein PXX05_01410 [Legionella cardiaca]
MLTYNGKELIKFKDKSGGKNKDDIDGFYRDSEGSEFFVKKPNDPQELFTELFAGLLLEEFKNRGLIPRDYHRSFICADFIRLNDGSYALIQPKVSFKELHKIIGTGNRNGSDRHALMEMFFGPSYYPLLTQLENYFGLSTILMYSLLLGDYSVHSGNVVCLETTGNDNQFARIDLGAAFRYYGYKENNINLLYPYEYHGWFNPTSFTKGYLLNYKKITGLFPAMAEKAELFREQLCDTLLEDIIMTVLKKIPADLVNDKTKERIATYIGIASFSDAGFGTTQPSRQFCLDFMTVFKLRLKKICKLTDVYPNPNKQKLYRSKSLENLAIVDTPSLTDNENLPFPDQLELWHQAFATKTGSFLLNEIKLPHIIKEFNHFLNLLITHVQLHDKSHAESSSPASQSSLINTSQSCVESDHLRQLFTLNTDGTPVFDERRLTVKKSLDFLWGKVETVLRAGFHIIMTIRIAQETKSVGANEEVENLIFALQEYLLSFHDNYQALLEHLDCADLTPSPTLFDTSQKSPPINDKGKPGATKMELASPYNLTNPQTNVNHKHLHTLTMQLQEKMQQDEHLKTALTETPKKQFSMKIIKDLFILKEFHDSKIALNYDNHLGNNYNVTVLKFYKRALRTRLSDASFPKQAEKLQNLAYQMFQPSKTQTLADALKVISILFGDLVVGLGRKTLGKQVFFRTASSELESDVIGKENLFSLSI